MPHPTTSAAVRDPEGSGAFIALDPAVNYPDGDPIVAAYPHFFAVIEDEGKVVESIPQPKGTDPDPVKKPRRRRVPRTETRDA